jgi:hypothetical protein
MGGTISSTNSCPISKLFRSLDGTWCKLSSGRFTCEPCIVPQEEIVPPIGVVEFCSWLSVARQNSECTIQQVYDHLNLATIFLTPILVSSK